MDHDRIRKILNDCFLGVQAQEEDIDRAMKLLEDVIDDALFDARNEGYLDGMYDQ